MFPVFLLIFLIGLGSAELSQQDVLDLIAEEIGGSCVAPDIGSCSSGESCDGTNCGGYYFVHKDSYGYVTSLFDFQENNC